MERKKKVIVSGYYGFNNSGDDAILKAIVKDLKEASLDIEITALSKNPPDTEITYGIKAVDRFNIIEILRELSKSDMLISGGGSLLQDITSTRSIIYYLALINTAKLLNKTVMVYANGIGPIRKRFNRILTKKVLNKVDLISLRDTNSRKTVEELGVTNKNVFVTADPVYTLNPSSESRIMDIFKEEGIPLDKPLIGIAIRDWKGTIKLREVLPKAIDYLKRNYNTNIVLIPMHYPEDLKTSVEMSNLAESECYVITNKYPVEDIMGIIKKLEMIVAMRLHSLIYAATQAVPMVGLVYDPKVEGFLDNIGLGSKCYIDKLELVEFCTIIDKVWNNRVNIRNDLERTREEFMKKAYENINMALDLIKSR